MVCALYNSSLDLFYLDLVCVQFDWGWCRGEEEQVADEVGSGLGRFKWETARVGEAMEGGEVDRLLNGRNF